jgi:hypothetical protein
MRKNLFILLLSLSAGVIFGQPVYPGQPIGDAIIRLSQDHILVENHVLCAQWTIQDQTIHVRSFLNKETGQQIDWDSMPWFSIHLQDQETLTSNDFRLLDAPEIRTIKENSSSLKRSGQDKGQEITADLYCERVKMKIHWQVILKDHSNYLRQQFTLIPKDSLKVDQITLLEIPQSRELKPDGIVAGSPWVDNEMFFGFEHPMSHNATSGNEDISFIKRYAPVTSSDSLTYSVAWGVAPKDQLRRAFLYYIERERAVPYRQELHYNSWFDSYGAKLNEKECLKVIQAFADSLIEKRHTLMQAFLFDDGWDNNKTLWQFNSGFPDGFSKMQELAKKYHSSLGVWMSPFGGYGKDKEQRIQYGLTQQPPFETNANGFSLAGPVYYKRFRDVMAGFVKKYRISIFKIDGVGEGDGAIGSNISYEKDIHALLRLVDDIRNVDPAIYFSLTTGTWASPYWLYYGDAIWRSGDDTGFAGTGTTRQQWITYRDGEAYRNIVLKGSLYPLNSLMYHGICIADHGNPATFDMQDKDISDDIWSFFASGTGLQELYINPYKLSSKNWDVLAHAIHWARNNAKTLVDVHWIGGDPESGEVYGRVAWSPHKGIISLRNPTGEIKHFHVDVMKAFEIPRGYPQTYNFRNPRFFQSDNADSINGVKEFDVTLQPYELKILECYDESKIHY